MFENLPDDVPARALDLRQRKDASMLLEFAP